MQKKKYTRQNAGERQQAAGVASEPEAIRSKRFQELGGVRDEVEVLSLFLIDAIWLVRGMHTRVLRASDEQSIAYRQSIRLHYIIGKTIGW